MAKILVVDDVEANRGVLGVLVAHRGHRMLEAANGLEALELARRERPDLVISDILMPVMDGFELVKALHDDPGLAATPVVFYTAYYREGEVRQLVEDGAVVAIITKPCEPEEMLRVIDESITGTIVAPAWSAADTSRFNAAHERLLVDKLSAQTAALELASERLAALINLNMELATAADPELLLEQTRRGAMHLTCAQDSVVVVRAPGEPESLYVVPAGHDAAGTDVKRQFGVVEEALAQDGSLRLGHTRGDGALESTLRESMGNRSLLIAPLKSLHASYGWICMLEKIAAPEFSLEDERLLTILASQSGRLYENGSLARGLRHQIEERMAAEGRLRAQYQVSHIVATAQAGEEPLEAILGTLCQTLGFQASTLWEVDEGKEHLRCRLAHVEPGFGLEKFARKSRSLVLRAGEGLPGRSWESGQVVWLRDIADDKSIPRRDVAREAGLHTAIVVPLLSQGSIIGMLDVFCLQPQEHNDETALTLTTIASHLAHCRERAAQERDISRLGRIQRLLSEVNAAVIRIRDRHKLYREVCRIALEVGGFGTVWIAQFDRHGKRLRVGASAGPVDVGSSLQAALEYLGNPVNSALATREIQAINDLALGGLADQPVCHELLAAGLRSLVVIPLISERVVVGIVGLGAAEPDYFHAGELSLTKELVASLGFAVEFITNERRLVRQAFYDPLTGLPNRSLFVERLERLLQAAARSGGSVAVALADLRHFRHINEVFGRRTGDGVLKCIADRLREVWPDRAHLCRVGGDRFAGMVVGHSDAHALIDGVLDPVTRALREPIVIDDHDLTVNITAGVASFPADGDDAETLMRRAEAAMLHARRKGERLRFFHVDSVADTSRVLNLEIRLRVALEQEQFILHYQPVVSIPDRDVVGLEALIRWNEPEKGLVPPAEFIPVLEETGLIVSVGRWIVRQAMIDCVQWRADGYHPPRVAINASAVELHHQKFVSTVERALRGFRRSGGSLAIELTESVLMHDMRDTIRKLEALRDLGVGISIDDFGTGYSSLGYLARLPVSSLKIDRSFILDLATSPQSMTMVSTIISLGHSLGLKVIAEGVETEEQFRLLHLLRCDYAQGYLISRPVPAEEVPAMLTEAE